MDGKNLVYLEIDLTSFWFMGENQANRSKKIMMDWKKPIEAKCHEIYFAKTNRSCSITCLQYFQLEWVCT